MANDFLCSKIKQFLHALGSEHIPLNSNNEFLLIKYD